MLVYIGLKSLVWRFFHNKILFYCRKKLFYYLGLALIYVQSQIWHYYLASALKKWWKNAWLNQITLIVKKKKSVKNHKLLSLIIL